MGLLGKAYWGTNTHMQCCISQGSSCGGLGGLGQVREDVLAAKTRTGAGKWTCHN